MKTRHLLLTVVFSIILAFMLYPKPVAGDNTASIAIKNIQPLPRVIMTDHLFKINATLVNNSPNPVLVENGACDAPFSVAFDKHVLVRKNDIYCTMQMIIHRIDPGNQMTFTSPYPALSYVAQSGGSVNATITFPYKIWNPENQSYGQQSLIKSFSFTIWNMTKVPTLSPSENQTLIDTALAIPGLQEWSHDWRYVSMGFGGNNKLGTPYFKWQYAVLNLKAPSTSAPVPCNNDWWAWVEIDMTTMKIVQATYPTTESHSCQVATGGGPGTILGSELANTTNIESPLKQFKSGIAAKDVKCNEGFQLVIKAEDNSPACLKPHAAYMLINHGWAREFIQPVKSTSQSTCEGTEVPSGDFRKNIFPVLIMRPDSVATVCVTYNFKSDWQTYPNKDVYPHGILETCCFVHMGRYSNPVSSNKFEIVGNPLLFNVTGVTNGSKVSVTYTIYSKPDSQGFYDTSVPFSECLSYPMAVGYNQSEIDSTKFHADFAIPCFNTIEDVSSVKIVSGMNYTLVNFHLKG